MDAIAEEGGKHQFTACTTRSTMYILKIEDTGLITFYYYNLRKVYFFIYGDPFLFDLLALKSWYELT
jgi:hypothetical protein